MSRHRRLYSFTSRPIELRTTLPEPVRLVNTVAPVTAAGGGFMRLCRVAIAIGLGGFLGLLAVPLLH